MISINVIMKTISLINEKELMELPHIGKVRAKLIKDKQSSTVYSERINDIYELSGVKGIGDFRLKEIIAYVKENDINFNF